MKKDKGKSFWRRNESGVFYSKKSPTALEEHLMVGLTKHKLTVLYL